MTVRFSKSDIQVFLEDGAGFCSLCQDITAESGIEPDAEEYQCEVCDGYYLMGVENAIILGLIEDDGSEPWE